MKVAWECLEVARGILENKSKSVSAEDRGSIIDYDDLLAEVYERLGDLQKFNGSYAESIKEYLRALELRTAVCQPSDRRLAMAHFNIAVAYVYNSGEEGVDLLAEKRRALKHYKAARAALLSTDETAVGGSAGMC